MYVCVYVYVCMYVCVHMCAYVCRCVYVCDEGGVGSHALKLIDFGYIQHVFENAKSFGMCLMSIN